MTAKDNQSHQKRVHDELAAAGMSSYGFLKGETRHLPGIIHRDEHIGGVIYGRYQDGSAMLVATDKRVLFLDHKPFFRMTNEVSYLVVSGVNFSRQGRYATVTLHTRTGEFEIRFVNLRSAGRFVQYIEKKQIEVSTPPAPPIQIPTPLVEQSQTPAQLSQSAKIFLATHDLGVLSTVAPDNTLQGAAVYYAEDKNGYIYIVTKTQTSMAKNIINYPQVAFTIFDVNSLQTLQISGSAQVETDPLICEHVYKNILRPRLIDRTRQLPPILNLPAGEYMVIVVTIIKAKFSDFKQ